MNTALIYISASVMQIFRGGIIIFSALLTLCIRKRKLTGYEWCAVALCIVSLVLVGLAAIFAGGSSTDVYTSWYYKLFGCSLVLISQLFLALQLVLEELNLADMNIPPLIELGVEGFWGLLMCNVICLPAAHLIPGNDNGSYENAIDTFYRLFHNQALIMYADYVRYIIL